MSPTLPHPPAARGAWPVCTFTGPGQPLFSAHCPFVTQRPRVSFQLSLGRAAVLTTAANSVHWVTRPQGARWSLLKAFGCLPGFCAVCCVNTVSHPHECFKEDSPKGARKGNTLLHVARSDHITLHTSGPSKGCVSATSTGGSAEWWWGWGRVVAGVGWGGSREAPRTGKGAKTEMSQ